MSNLPRLALGALSPALDPQPLCWALIRLLSRTGLRVQHFRSSATLSGISAPLAAAGRVSRHLDSWLMTPRQTRQVFAQKASSRDLALVEGAFTPLSGAASSLATLCQWLGLPRIGLVDAQLLDPCSGYRPTNEVDALLIDRLEDARQFFALQLRLERQSGKPVLGGLPLRGELRQELAQAQYYDRTPGEALDRLADALEAWTQWEAIVELAAQCGPLVGCDASTAPGDCAQRSGGLRIALAYDEAFHCYFPDALDGLEASGATIVDFSPLRDEALPPQTDLVYLGCGHPERFAAGLSGNHCLIAALREHVRSGRPVYAEGGGLPYISQALRTSEGAEWPMAGLLPVVARQVGGASSPSPIEATLIQDCLLGTRGSRLRGYRNSSWRVEPTAALPCATTEEQANSSLFVAGPVVGSLLHLHFSLQPRVLGRLLRAAACS